MPAIDWDTDLETARERLLELVRTLAYREGVDILLSSGKRSTFYVDGKKITLHPEGLCLFARLLLAELEQFPEVRAVGGMSIGADPIAAAVCALSFPSGRPLEAFLVRKSPKEHGTAKLIEGQLQTGDRVAIVEDTITTGASSRRAIEAVRLVGAEPAVVLALVDRCDPDADAFRREFRVRALFTRHDLTN